jgi:hypothetical protein
MILGFPPSLSHQFLYGFEHWMCQQGHGFASCSRPAPMNAKTEESSWPFGKPATLPLLAVSSSFGANRSPFLCGAEQHAKSGVPDSGIWHSQNHVSNEAGQFPVELFPQLNALRLQSRRKCPSPIDFRDRPLTAAFQS